MNCYLNIRNPRSSTVPSSFSCDYRRGPFTLFSRRLSSNVVGQGVPSRVSNPLVDGRWTCARWITCAKVQHPKTSIIRLSTIRAIEYDSVRFLFVRHENVLFLKDIRTEEHVILLRQENMRTRGRVNACLRETRT